MHPYISNFFIARIIFFFLFSQTHSNPLQHSADRPTFCESIDIRAQVKLKSGAYIPDNMTNGGPTTLKSALKNTGSGDKQSKSVSFAQMGPRITVDTAPAQQWLLHGGLSHEYELPPSTERPLRPLPRLSNADFMNRAASRDPRAQMVVITAGHKQFYCCLDTLASRCGFFSGAMAAMKGKVSPSWATDPGVSCMAHSHHKPTDYNWKDHRVGGLSSRRGRICSGLSHG